MARYHIILGNGQGCGEHSSHAAEEEAQSRATLLDANGHGPCRIWEEDTEDDDSELTADDYIKMYGL